MASSPDQFAYWLTQAIHLIKAKERKKIETIQDELAYALGRDKGGAATIGYWRKGNVPADTRLLEHLATLLVQRGGLNRRTCEQFLRTGGHARPELLLESLFQSGNPQPLPRAARALAPFVTQQPITEPAQFFGRERECSRIFAWWRHSPLHNVAIIGPRHSGRTSLLHYLRTINTTPARHLRPGQRHDWLPEADRYRWIYIDFFDPRWHRRDNLLRYVLAELGLPAHEPCTLESFIETISNGLPQPTIIMLDELGAALEMAEYDGDFWRSMRALVTSVTRGALAFAIAALDDLQTLAAGFGKTSPFFNLFTSVRLGPLTSDEARALIAVSPQTFAPDDSNWILIQSQGWPILVQLLCQARLAALEEEVGGEGWKADGLAQINRYRYLLDGAPRQ